MPKLHNFFLFRRSTSEKGQLSQDQDKDRRKTASVADLEEQEVSENEAATAPDLLPCSEPQIVANGQTWLDKPLPSPPPSSTGIHLARSFAQREAEPGCRSPVKGDAKATIRVVFPDPDDKLQLPVLKRTRTRVFTSLERPDDPGEAETAGTVQNVVNIESLRGFEEYLKPVSTKRKQPDPSDSDFSLFSEETGGSKATSTDDKDRRAGHSFKRNPRGETEYLLDEQHAVPAARYPSSGSPGLKAEQSQCNESPATSLGPWQQSLIVQRRVPHEVEGLVHLNKSLEASELNQSALPQTEEGLNHDEVWHDTADTVEDHVDIPEGGFVELSRPKPSSTPDRPILKVRSHENCSTESQQMQQTLFSCEECNMTFPTQFTLDRHIRNFHEDMSWPVICGECLMAFPGRRGLNRHWRAVHADKEVDGETSAWPEDADLRMAKLEELTAEHGHLVLDFSGREGAT